MAPRGQARRNSDAASIESEIAHLRDLDLKALRIRWRGVTGRAAPSHLPKHLQFAMLAYRIQCDTFGDLDAASLHSKATSPEITSVRRSGSAELQLRQERRIIRVSRRPKPL
jgi:hypothetical protein